MNSWAHFHGRQIVIACMALAVLVMAGCEQSKPTAPAATRSASVAGTEEVFVVFEGPWAMVDDPKDANSVLALAPKSKIHSDLYVAASNDSLLGAGVYDLSVPAHGPAASGALDPAFAQAKISAAALQQAIDSKAGRYVIRLPKPEAYVAAKRFVSRVGASYPPDASTERNYASFVSLRYSVASLTGFSLAGTPDSGTFNPLLLQLETPTIRFAIEPSTPDDLTDQCHTHSRAAFRDTVKFLGLTLFVDFPGDPTSCHTGDPQAARPVKADAGQTSPFDRAGALLQGDLVEKQEANIAGISGQSLLAAFYLLHAADGSCKAPIVFLSTTS